MNSLTLMYDSKSLEFYYFIIIENIICYINMERLIEVELKKVHILEVLNSYYKIFPLVYVGFDSEGITLQGSCDE